MNLTNKEIEELKGVVDKIRSMDLKSYVFKKDGFPNPFGFIEEYNHYLNDNGCHIDAIKWDSNDNIINMTITQNLPQT